VIAWPGTPENVQASLADVPHWLLELLDPPSNPKPPPLRQLRSADFLAHYRRSTDEAAAMARLQGVVAFVAASPEGERNVRLYWGACRLRDMLEDGELPPHEAGLALATLAEAGSVAGLPAREIERTLTSATR
jgi:hypothetical protein